MTVLVVVPVLGRPERVWPLADSLRDSIRDAFCDLLFVASPDDDAELEAIWGRQDAVGDVSLVAATWEPGPADWAKKINAAYRGKGHRYDWIFTGADDLRFHEGWADEALRVAAETGAGVVGTNDLGNPRVTSGKHSTHSLVARWYADEHGTIDGPGAVVSDEYDHNFVDDELVATAKARRSFAFAERSHVEHLHPHWRKGEMDATYEKGLARFSADRAVFHRRGRRIRRERIAVRRAS